MMTHSQSVAGERLVDQASDLQARRNSGSGLIPRCDKVFFIPESAFSADSLLMFAQHLCAITGINICVHAKNPRH